MMRASSEDVRAQEEAVATARVELGRCLSVLAGEAAAEFKVTRTKRGQANLETVTAAHNAVLRAGEALDIAVYDLQTAAGADG